MLVGLVPEEISLSVFRIFKGFLSLGEKCEKELRIPCLY